MLLSYIGSMGNSQTVSKASIIKALILTNHKCVCVKGERIIDVNVLQPFPSQQLFVNCPHTTLENLSLTRWCLYVRFEKKDTINFIYDHCDCSK